MKAQKTLITATPSASFNQFNPRHLQRRWRNQRD
jgi:hypothetical protein